MARPPVGRWFTVNLILAVYKGTRRKWFTKRMLEHYYYALKNHLDGDAPSWKTVENNLAILQREGLLEKSFIRGHRHRLQVYVIKPRFWQEVRKWMTLASE